MTPIQLDPTAHVKMMHLAAATLCVAIAAIVGGVLLERVGHPVAGIATMATAVLITILGTSRMGSLARGARSMKWAMIAIATITVTLITVVALGAITVTISFH